MTPLIENQEDVIQLLGQIGDQEKHFNYLETQYRLMASGWLLASFGGIGFLLEDNIHLPVHPGILIGLIGAVGCAGITLLWLLDIKIYHKLLNCVFLQGIYLENTYPFLPKIRTDMLMSQETGDVIASTSLFYQGSASLLIFTSAFGFSMFFNEIISLGLVIILALSLWALLMIYMYKATKSPRSKHLKEKIQATYTDLVLLQQFPIKVP
jgi:hypothetical protein